MIQMTKIPGVPEKKTAKPGMAFYEGSGPLKKTCGDCDLMKSVERTLRCSQFTKMAGKDGPPIRTYYDACKYFKQRKP